MQDMSCAELVKEAAKIIYMVHDEVKDKMFEMELSWVGEFTNGVHQKVPDNVSLSFSAAKAAQGMQMSVSQSVSQKRVSFCQIY